MIISVVQILHKRFLRNDPHSTSMLNLANKAIQELSNLKLSLNNWTEFSFALVFLTWYIFLCTSLRSLQEFYANKSIIFQKINRLSLTSMTKMTLTCDEYRLDSIIKISYLFFHLTIKPQRHSSSTQSSNSIRDRHTKWSPYWS